jgi:hypothetical protein
MADWYLLALQEYEKRLQGVYASLVAVLGECITVDKGRAWKAAKEVAPDEFEGIECLLSEIGNLQTAIDGCRKARKGVGQQEVGK